ncbi:MAG: ATP-binding protein [Deltaproteobacteria bacterium]|nr:ATP-binding protein [Deltaproteobacteria bacterium]
MSGSLYRSFFGLHREPFSSELKIEEIITTPALEAVTERFDYVLRLGAIGLLTGEVGAGKSTALRWASSRLHPAQYHILWLTASGGSILETYRQLAGALDVETKTFSRATLTRIIRQGIYELVNKKIQPVLIIDEANLLRLEVFAELHTICQFEADSKPHLPMILAGQNNLLDLLQYRSSLPLSSRIVARTATSKASILIRCNTTSPTTSQSLGSKHSCSLPKRSLPSSKAPQVYYEELTTSPVALSSLPRMKNASRLPPSMSDSPLRSWYRDARRGRQKPASASSLRHAKGSK